MTRKGAAFEIALVASDASARRAGEQRGVTGVALSASAEGVLSIERERVSKVSRSPGGALVTGVALPRVEIPIRPPVQRCLRRRIVGRVARRAVVRCNALVRIVEISRAFAARGEPEAHPKRGLSTGAISQIHASVPEKDSKRRG